MRSRQDAWQLPMAEQYRTPVTTGESSSEVAATIASSSGQAAVEETLAQEGARLQVASEGEEVCFSEALAALRRARGGIVRRGELARAQMALRGRQQQVTLFHAVAALALDQSLRPAEPSTGAARVAASEETKAEPERRACGGQAVAGVR